MAYGAAPLTTPIRILQGSGGTRAHERCAELSAWTEDAAVALDTRPCLTLTRSAACRRRRHVRSCQPMWVEGVMTR